MQKNKNILIDAIGEQMPGSSIRCRTVAVMLNGCRVVLEGLTVCHCFQMLRCWNGCRCDDRLLPDVRSCRRCDVQVVKFFYLMVKFFDR